MKRPEHLEEIIKWTRNGTGSLKVAGLSGAAEAYFVSHLLNEADRPCLAILPDRKSAERLYRELSFFMPRPKASSVTARHRLFEFPSYDLSPLTGLSPHRQVVTRRLQTLYALVYEERPVVITSLDAIFLRILPKDAFVRSLDFLAAGEEVDRDLLIRRLHVMGYNRSSLVEEVGDYSVRGGVIDLFPPLYESPVRLEFWGDRLESIRLFDALSQRSKDALDEVILPPAGEIIRDTPNLARARSMGRLPRTPETGAGFAGEEAWLNHFYSRLDTLLDYLPDNGLVALFDPHRVTPAYGKLKKRFEDDLQRFRKEAAEKGSPFPETGGILVPLEEISDRLARLKRLELSPLALDDPDDPRPAVRVEGAREPADDLQLRLAGKGRVSMAPLAEMIASRVSARARVVIVCRTRQQAERLSGILENYEVKTDQVAKSWGEIPEGPGLTICLGRLSRGFSWPDLGLFVVSEDEIFGSKRARHIPGKKPGSRGINWSGFSQLKSGDLVVHEEHGIGRYGGLEKMEIENRTNEFVVIEYARNDRLYIPADRVSVLQKYVGADREHPRLDRLGGRSWNIAKRRVRKSVRTIARQLVEIYALRKYRKGHAFSPPDTAYREFEATFEHEETPDQTRAIEEVLADMASEQPMDRLICGDVGFGKTEIALRAAFRCVSDGKQAAVLVPTTVLAEQHYETFQRRMRPYGIRIGILSRFKTRKEQAETLARLRSGKIDILVGTHRMLQKDVRFRDMGLLIIDEEQRFGVKQKEVLKKYRSMVDVLAITATPIPRTLHMSLMGIRDLSVIETPPQDRLSIQTYLSRYDDAVIGRALRFELEREGQVFFVHNRVQDIEEMADRLRRLVPEARLAVAHGQMREKELEDTMMRFLHREVDVLVCTTIIESGLDIPSANTIIINEVDRMGLAQIYQLRGRVGRSKDKAYAYLLVSNGSVLTRDAEKRLQALMDFSHLGAGLHLAMHDLEIRGGGNMLGYVQSGEISAVGYELYLKLIERAIAELRGETWEEEINPEIHADVSAYLPEDYVMDTDVRLNLYRRLSGLREAAELAAVREEIRDRFGPPPPEVRNLLDIMSLRLLLKQRGITRLDVGPASLTVTFSPGARVDPERLARAAGAAPDRFRFLPGDRLRVLTGPISPERDLADIEKTIETLTAP